MIVELLRFLNYNKLLQESACHVFELWTYGWSYRDRIPIGNEFVIKSTVLI